MITISVAFEKETAKLLAFIEKMGPAIDREASLALDQSTASILSSLRKTFLAEQDPAGVPWKPSAAGLRRKVKGGTGTLFDTGRLFRSIQLYKDADLVRRISTDVPYGPKLQLDPKTPRPFLRLTENHIETASKIFKFRMRRLFREQGL